MRRSLILLTIIIIFLIIGASGFKILNNSLNENSRILLLSDTENSKDLKKTFPKIKGDYLVAFNGTEQIAEVIYLNENLTLIDKENEAYGSIKYYKDQEKTLYIRLLGENFDENIRDSIIFEETGVQKNISESGQEIYKDTIEKIEELLVTLSNDGLKYNVQDNDLWVRVFKNINYETEGRVNKNIVKEVSKKFKSDPKLKQKVITSFVNLYIPKLECNSDVCTYNQENIKAILKNINSHMVMKMKYTFEYDTSYQKIDQPISEENQNKLQSLEATEIDESKKLTVDPLGVTEAEFSKKTNENQATEELPIGTLNDITLEEQPSGIIPII